MSVTGYVLMDIVAVLALAAVLGWGVVKHRRWRKRHPLPERPKEEHSPRPSAGEVPRS